MLTVRVRVYETVEHLDGQRKPKIPAKPIRDFTIDQHIPEDRKRLAKCAMWAMYQGHMVQTVPVGSIPIKEGE